MGKENAKPTRAVFVYLCVCWNNKQEPLLCVYLQCDGTRLPRDPHVPGDLDVDGDPVQAQQSPPVLLSALTSAGRRDNWDFCSPKSIIITQSYNMSCLIICI